MKLKCIYCSLFALLLLYGALPIQAQDKILRNNPEELIHGKVKEVKDNVVVYTRDGFPDDLLFEVSNANTDKIVYADSAVQVFSRRGASSIKPVKEQLNAITFEAIIVTFKQLSVNYQRLVKPNQSFTSSVVIGGITPGIFGRSPIGLGVSAGYRWLFSPTWKMDKVGPWNFNSGFYLNPELKGVCFRAYDKYGDNNKNKYINSAGALMLNAGLQFSIAKKVMIDIYAGVGYGIYNDEVVETGINYPFFGPIRQSSPLCLDYGARIGFMF